MATSIVLCFLFCLFSLALSAPDPTEFTLHLFNDTTTQARCLDGSPYGIYHAPGFSTGLNKVIISFWGGGLCGGRTKEAFFSDCVSRSQTNLGSSNPWDRIAYYKSGSLSGLESESPNFFNWNRFDLPYCDGSFHQGHISDPVSFNGTELYFRGVMNVRTALNYITSVIDFKTIDLLVVAGGSTGGYATFTWSEHISAMIKEFNPNTKVIAIPDRGFFVDYYNYMTKDRDYYFQNKLFYEIVNKEIPPLTSDCLKEHPGTEDLCLFPEYFVKFVNMPMLLTQSGYDSSNLFETVGLECVANNTLSGCNQTDQEYAHKFKVYQNSLIKKEIERHKSFSAWLPACVTHCFDDKLNSQNWEVPQNSGMTVSEAVKAFLQNPEERKIYVDEGYWPSSNGNCANVVQGLLQRS